MTTSQRQGDDVGGADATSRSILLLDLSSASETSTRLHAELCRLTNPTVVVKREFLNGLAQPAALEQISAFAVSPALDLLVVVLSDIAQAFAEKIFQVFRNRHRGLPILVVPGSDDSSAVHELYQWGASDYLLPPFRSADVHPRIRRLLAYGESQKTSVAAVKEALGLRQFVGESRALLEQVRKIPQIARCNASVLVVGETGTGKEVCARAIHYLSPRADRPFVPLNCGAIPVELLENELFGHAAGAFTSAGASQFGVIREAEGGTLFLDEIDALPVSSQVKLLRFLQDKEYRPLGARKAAIADVRIVAATNSPLEQLVLEGKLRRDLFYRLNVLRLELPPLRERREDIPLLARHFLTRYSAEFGSPAAEITPAALRKLVRHPWPGNVRELENVIERAVALSTSAIVNADEIDVPEAVAAEAEPESFSLLKARVVAEFERNYLRRLLEEHRGNIGQAARSARKNRRAFFQLMRKHRIRVEQSVTGEDGRQLVRIVIAPSR